MKNDINRDSAIKYMESFAIPSFRSSPRPSDSYLLGKFEKAVQDLKNSSKSNETGLMIAAVAGGTTKLIGINVYWVDLDESISTISLVSHVTGQTTENVFDISVSSAGGFNHFVFYLVGDNTDFAQAKANAPNKELQVFQIPGDLVSSLSVLNIQMKSVKGLTVDSRTIKVFQVVDH